MTPLSIRTRKKKPRETGAKQGNPPKKRGGTPPVDKQFGKPGGNPINKRGRALNNFDALRREWQAVWSEILYDSEGKPIVDDVTGEKLTRIVARMRTATSSRNPREFEIALAYAYGKPVDKVDVTSAGRAITWKDFIGQDADAEADSK